MSARRIPGRRIADRPERGPAPSQSSGGRAPGLLVALLAVVVVVAGLAWAATAPRLHPVRVDSSRTTPVARDFSCVGGLAHASAEVGVAGASADGLTVDGSAPKHAAISLTATPVHVNAPASLAARAFAVRTAAAPKKGKTGSWYAAGACPTPRSSWWFVGVGGSQSHRTILTLANPRRGDAIVNVSVLGPSGAVRVPGLTDLRVDSGSERELDLSQVAPAVGDLAVRVFATRGLVTASAADSWSPDFVQSPVHDWVTPQPRASKDVTLGGLPQKTSRATLLLANPSSVEAVVTLALVGPHGQFSPTSDAVMRVAPRSVQTVSLNKVLTTSPSALRLTSQVPISATVRVQRSADDATLPTISRLDGTSVTGVPAHRGSARLQLIGERSRPSTVTVTSYDAAGRRLAGTSLTLQRSTSTAVTLPAKAAAVVVDGSGFSGALVLGESTKTDVAVLALDPTASEAHVPVVSPRW